MGEVQSASAYAAPYGPPRRSWSRRHGAHGGAVTDDVIDEMNHPDRQAARLDSNGRAIELQLTSEHGALFATGGQPGLCGLSPKLRDLHFVGSTDVECGSRRFIARCSRPSAPRATPPKKDRQLKMRLRTQASVFGDQASGSLIARSSNLGTGSIVIRRALRELGEIMSAEGHAGGVQASCGWATRTARAPMPLHERPGWSGRWAARSKAGSDTTGKKAITSERQARRLRWQPVRIPVFHRGVRFGLRTSATTGETSTALAASATPAALVGCPDHSALLAGLRFTPATTRAPFSPTPDNSVRAGLFSHAVPREIRNR